ncbi:hypothetical protein AALP_AAs42393U000100 [Arabis alpina]|uniref:Uncharacterized protein n=1 Tax=Arabis alpina TaxID=50452 RepID=A0A087FXN1_ARAAL|nr:hypothetical protein AALP_AAs42393U000100 [Arabis alpina]
MVEKKIDEESSRESSGEESKSSREEIAMGEKKNLEMEGTDLKSPVKLKNKNREESLGTDSEEEETEPVAVTTAKNKGTVTEEEGTESGETKPVASKTLSKRPMSEETSFPMNNASVDDERKGALTVSLKTTDVVDPKRKKRKVTNVDPKRKVTESQRLWTEKDEVKFLKAITKFNGEDGNPLHGINKTNFGVKK